MPIFDRLLKKKIPTLIGILFLVGGLAVGVFVMEEGTGGFLPRASPESTPKQVRVTNVSDTSFTVSFITDSATPGFVKYGLEANNLNQQSADDRDQQTGTVSPYNTHHITVRGLTPATKYYVALGTGTRNIFTDNGAPYTVTTAPRLGVSPEAATAFGTVLTSAQTPATDSIVYLEIQGGAPLSAYVRSSGSFSIPVGTTRRTDLTAFLNPEPTTPVSIVVQGKDSGQTASITSTLAQSTPFETITLGGAGAKTASQSPQGSLAQPTENTMEQSATVGITFTNPSVEGESLNTTQPELRGTGPANTTLQIKIESNPVFQGTVQTSPTGQWSYTPPGNLEPGDHTMTVSYVDANGQTQTQKRTFRVLAQGTSSNPAFTSTPSGSLAGTGGSASASGQASASATPPPTPKPLASGSATATTSTSRVAVATGSPQPQSGGFEFTALMMLLGMGLIGVGLITWNKAMMQ